MIRRNAHGTREVDRLSFLEDTRVEEMQADSL